MSKLLVPFDGSENSKRALLHAIQWVRAQQTASIHVVHAHEEPDIYGEIAVYVSSEKMAALQRQMSEARLAEAEEVLKSASELRPPAPPVFTDADMDEVKKQRTGRERALGFKWAVTSISRHYNDRLTLLLFESGQYRDPLAAARAYATLSLAYYDTLVACWDAKYAYWGIRPFQYDSNYRSLFTTPNFPGYPSGHAMFAGVASAVLGHFSPGTPLNSRAKPKKLRLRGCGAASISKLTTTKGWTWAAKSPAFTSPA